MAKNKSFRIGSLLMRSLRSGPLDDCGNGTCGPAKSSRGSDEPAARDMADLLHRLDNIADPAVLLGTEGQAAVLYFGQFNRMLKAPTPGPTFEFKTRNRRPPRDPVNALLSFGYAVLLKDSFSALCTVGFDPYCGFFHVGRHGKPSLALDLMEEFRAVIVDSVVLTLINTAALTPHDFLTYRELCQLTEDGRKRFFQAYEQRKSTVVTHPVFGYKMACRMLEVPPHGIDWICVSPKARADLVLRQGDELKLIYPQKGLSHRNMTAWIFVFFQLLDGSDRERNTIETLR